MNNWLGFDEQKIKVTPERKADHHAAIRAGQRAAIMFADNGEVVRLFFPAGASQWEIVVPEWAVPHVVGRGGAHIRALEEVVGVPITVEGDGDFSVEAPARPRVLVDVFMED